MAVDINDTPNRIRYTATAGQTAFSVPFQFSANADLKVYKNGTLLTLSTHYSVTGAGASSGTVTLLAGATLSDDVLIVRDLPIERIGDFPVSGPFDVDSLNRQLDTLTMMLRDIETRLERRILRLAVADTPESMSDLPAKATRAGKMLGFDASGNPETVLLTSTLSSMQAVLDAKAAVEALLDQFDDRYLGAKAANPSVDNDGNALQVGAIFFHTGENKWKAWGGAAWYPSDTMGATSAALVTFSPTGTIASSNVQAAIAEIISDLAATTGAATVGTTATGYITASNVQAALTQIAEEKTVSTWESIKLRMRLGRVDFVGIGDSNQLFNGIGWDYAFHYALNQLFPMYATGLISINENNADGGGIGYTYNYNGAAPLIGVTSGAPTFFDNYLVPGTTLHQYGYLASGSFATTENSGLTLNAGCILDNTAALTFDFYYGTFAAGSGGVVNAGVRLGDSPYSTLATSGNLSTTTGTDGISLGTVSISADAGRSANSLNFKWALGANIAAPFFGLYVRASNPARTTGWSYHTLRGQGGDSLKDMAAAIQNMTDAMIGLFLAETRRLQGTTKTVVFCVNSGLNDRSETDASVGPSPATPGDSAAAFVDNFTYIRNRIMAVWTANGWNLDELFFLTFVSHPVSSPDDAKLVSYRTAILNYMNSVKNAQVINLANLTTATEMTANSWYVSVGDKNHLSTAGYQNLGIRLIGKLQ